MTIRRIKVLCALIFAITLFSFAPAHADTSVDSDINSNAEWTLAGSPYIVTSDVAVQDGAVLTVDPGVTVKFSDGASLGVFGVIHASGSSTQPIVFTSASDAPQQGSWSGLVFLGNYNQTFSNVTFSYADTPFSVHAGTFALDHITCSYVMSCLEFTSGSATIDTLTVDHPTKEVIGLLGGSNVAITNATFTNLSDVHAPDIISSYVNSTLALSNASFDGIPAIAEGMSTFINSSLSINHGTFGSPFKTTTDSMSAYNNSTLNVTNTDIVGNGSGDGVEVYAAGTFQYSNGKISNFGGSGVATYNQDDETPSTLSLDHAIIANNATGIEMDGTPAITTDTLSIHDNSSGGAVYNHDDGKNVSMPNVWWGDASGPYNATTNPNGLGNSVANDISVDPILTSDPFDENETPATYYAKISGLSQGFANMRESPSASATLVKTLPVDYVVEIVSKTNDDGTDALDGGYRWYKIQDPTDGSTGWMIAGSDSSDTPTYLPYDEDAQQEESDMSATVLDTKAKRQPIITSAIQHYFGNSDTTPSLYSSDDTIANKISTLAAAGFPQELALAIIVQESGGVQFNNEIVTPDYGHGVMQVTPNYFSNEKSRNYQENSSKVLGKYSDVKDLICSSDGTDNYTNCYQNAGTFDQKHNKPYDFFNHDPSNPKYKQYSNTQQSIYANIKDGLGVLNEKYNLAFSSKCKQETYTVDGETFSCDDLRKIKAVWAYNGIDLTETNNYLELISQKLANLTTYFPGISYNDSDHLIEKLTIANNHRKEIKVHSPVDLQVKDTNTNETTGVLLDGTVVEDIDNSIYDPDSESALILFPIDNYQYNLVGTATSSYGFDVSNSVGDQTEPVFTATDVPVQDGALHTYTLDEQALSQGETGATLTIDNNADGTPEETIESGPVMQDLKPPTIDLSSLKDTYTLGEKINLKNVASDNVSAKSTITFSAKLDDTDLPVTNKTLTLPLIGDHTLSVTATDDAGNASTATKQLRINYVFGGILFTPTASNNEYSKGKVVTVHFTLTGKNKVLVPADHPGIDVVRDSDGFHAKVNPDVSDANGLCDLGENCFTKTNNTYKFKLKTSKLTVGSWTITITIGDGSTYTAPLLIQ